MKPMLGETYLPCQILDNRIIPILGQRGKMKRRNKGKSKGIKKENISVCIKNNAVLNYSVLWILEGTGNTALNKVQYLSLIDFPS